MTQAPGAQFVNRNTYVLGSWLDPLVWTRVLALRRRRFRTRPELANAIFKYIETFDSFLRRHTAIDWLTRVEFENVATIAGS